MAAAVVVSVVAVRVDQTRLLVAVSKSVVSTVDTLHWVFITR